MKLHTTSLSRAILAVGVLAAHVAANADKIIFTAPEPVTYPLGPPSLADLGLDVLGPERLSIRTNLSRIFHGASDGKGLGTPPGVASWFLLDDLTEGQRYELRVCWAAIEPTEFTMDAYDLDTVWDTPELITSLATYSSTRQTQDAAQTGNTKPQIHKQKPSSSQTQQRKASLLLLRVHAAADYFSHDPSLMREPPPPVLVDLILDPYLFNAVPTSLLPTAGYIVVVAAVALLVARWVAGRMSAMAAVEEEEGSKKKQ